MEPISSYEAAYKELTEIASSIESEMVSVDQLAVQVKRAAELVAFCQSRLRSTEAEVEKIIKQMENKDE